MLEYVTSNTQSSSLVPAAQGIEVTTEVDPSFLRVTIFKKKSCTRRLWGGKHAGVEEHSCVYINTIDAETASEYYT